jgi:hypothetical protein
MTIDCPSQAARASRPCKVDLVTIEATPRRWVPIRHRFVQHKVDIAVDIAKSTADDASGFRQLVTFRLIAAGTYVGLLLRGLILYTPQLVP